MSSSIIAKYQADTARRTKKRDDWFARMEARERHQRMGASCSKHDAGARQNQPIVGSKKNYVTRSEIQ